MEMEMAAEKYVLGIAAVGDTEEGFARLCTVQKLKERNKSDQQRYSETEL